MGRAPCCDKANVKKGPWSPEEDAKLKAYIEENGTGGNWIALPQKIGLKRCGKSCRLRWLNYLRPNIRHGGFSEEEDYIICSLYINIGSRWSIIAAQLPGRTDNDIKNYWNTSLKKKLLGKQQKQKQARRASWPPQQPPFTPLTNTNHGHLRSNTGTTIHNSMNSPYPFDFSFAQGHLYENSFSLLSSASSINPINNTCSQVPNRTHFNSHEAGPRTDTFQGHDCFPGELIYSNNQQIFHGLDGFYGTDNICSVGFPQTVSGFEACQQSTAQVPTYDEQHCTWAV